MGFELPWFANPNPFYFLSLGLMNRFNLQPDYQKKKYIHLNQQIKAINLQFNLLKTFTTCIRNSKLDSSFLDIAEIKNNKNK